MNPTSAIRLIVSDVDGVWTDGRIIYVGERSEIKEFSVRDGLAVAKSSIVGHLFAGEKGMRSSVRRDNSLRGTGGYG